MENTKVPGFCAHLSLNRTANNYHKKVVKADLFDANIGKITPTQIVGGGGSGGPTGGLGLWHCIIFACCTEIGLFCTPWGCFPVCERWDECIVCVDVD